MADDYAAASAASFYPYEVTAVKKALDHLEKFESPELLGDAYVHSAEIKLASGGAVFATLWFDTESESWRAQVTREEE